MMSSGLSNGMCDDVPSGDGYARAQNLDRGLWEDSYRMETRIICLERAEKNLLQPKMRLFNGCSEDDCGELKWLFGVLDEATETTGV